MNGFKASGDGYYISHPGSSTETIPWINAAQLDENSFPRSMPHLLSQISFLHKEVERLEEQLANMRSKMAKEEKKMVQEYEYTIQQKNAEIAEWRRKNGQRKNDVDLFKRCTNLEKQLAAINAEKSVLSLEKNDVLDKLRKMELLLKTRKAEWNAMDRVSKEEHTAVNNQLLNLSQVNKELSDKVKSLQEELATSTRNPPKMSDTGTQTDKQEYIDIATEVTVVGTQEKECQIESAMHFADATSQSIHNLYSTLEKKTQECDACRAQLADLHLLQEDTLRVLENTRKRLSEEIERRKLIDDDAAKLLIQVQSLQQKNSAQSATERDLLEKTSDLEERRQQLRSEVIHLKQERSTWETQLKQYEKDIEQLVCNKNYSNQQLSLLANENENLRAEVQRLLTRESQLIFALKAKDIELQEILLAYQNSTKENDTILGNQRFLERELDSVRATLASKEECIIYHQEQLSCLHQREQQLVLDLQTFEYENDQLHRKILHSEAFAQKMETKCQDFQQLIGAKDQSIEELHQSLAELSKQVVFSENECALTRRRCESLEGDLARLQAALSAESQKGRQLEDSNARLITRNVLASSSNAEALQQQIRDQTQELATLKEKIEAESKAKQNLTKTLEETQDELADLKQCKEKLERIVFNQTKTLSTLSK